jgi:putative transposase
MIEDIKRETTSRVEAARCRIILLLDKKLSVGQIARMVDCVRSTVYTTLYRFEDEGLNALADRRLWPEPRKATAQVRAKLLSYLDKVPKDYGWQRSTWTLELLARQLQEDTGVQLSPSHLRNVLAQEKCRRGRPRPALRIPVQGRREILENIAYLKQAATQDEEFVYVDEADLDLNPRIGLTYMKRGQQALVLTPGQNVKYYIAGALNPRTGTVLYSHGPKKNSQLFVDLLHVLNRSYRRARVINVVLDNYIIHKSRKTLDALSGFGDKIRLHFLPPYSPEHNPIERLWKQLHDNVTRNHRHPNMPSLWKDVTTFMAKIQPFPGTKFSTLKESA